MGAPKQKWTSEEESALKAGVVKHGPGKWRTILKDPDFSGILSLRSNVDLKDKWRNMSVTANGWGSREKARLALKRSQHMSRSEEDTSDTSQEAESDDEIVDAKPLSLVMQTASSRQSRLESLIIEAITGLKEPNGSNKPNIAMYIEVQDDVLMKCFGTNHHDSVLVVFKDQYKTPPNFKKILSSKLKSLTASGKLIKVNRKYRIAPSASFSQAKRTSGVPLLEGRSRDSIRTEKNDIPKIMKSQIDSDLTKLRTMNVHDAAAAAARAVAEAEAAMAEAEEAAKVAEAAEADAEAAQAFAEAAMATLKNKYTNNLMVHG